MKKTCVVCGKEFEPRAKTGITCGVWCRRRRARDQYSTKRRQEKLAVIAAEVSAVTTAPDDQSKKT